MHRLSIALWLVLLITCAIAGCTKQTDKSTGRLARGPDVQTLIEPYDYAAGALEATGGFKKWTKTKRLSLDSVVTFYQPDGSFYLTQQHLEVFPSRTCFGIRISLQEHPGMLLWQFSEGQLTILKGREQDAFRQMQVSYRDYAEAILSLITAPISFLDASVSFKRQTEPMKVGGLWYDRFERKHIMNTDGATNGLQEGIESIKPRWDRIFYYQNKINSFIDLLWFCDIDRQEYLAVRGYDYSEVEEKGILLPTKIEIFTTDARCIFDKRLLTIDITLPRVQQ
jgi:hypothetical protein